MQRLMRVTDEALQWLWTVYWSRLEEPQSDEAKAGDLTQLRTNAKQILRSYRSTRLEALRSNKKHVGNEALLKIGEACLNLFERNQRRIETFVEVLVQDKILIPQKREPGSPIDGAYLIWDPLLQVIAQRQKRFLQTLVHSLLACFSSDTAHPPEKGLQKEAFMLWALHVLSYRVHSGHGTSDQPTLQRECMKWCCMNPGYWSTKLGESLLQVIDTNFASEWREIFEASQLDFELIRTEDAQDPGPVLEDPILHVVETREYADTASWVRAAAPVRGPLGTSG